MMNPARRIQCFVLARLPDSVERRHEVLSDLVEVFPGAQEPRRLLALLDSHIAAQRELVFADGDSEIRGHPRLGDRPLARGSGRLGDKAGQRGGAR